MNFALILFVLVILTGIAWVADKLVFQPQRRRAADAAVAEFDRQQAQPKSDEEFNLGGGIKIQTDKKQLTIVAPGESGKIVDVFAGKEYLFTATVNDQGEIHLAKNSSIAQEMIRRYTNNENIKLRPV